MAKWQNKNKSNPIVKASPTTLRHDHVTRVDILSAITFKEASQFTSLINSLLNCILMVHAN